MVSGNKGDYFNTPDTTELQAYTINGTKPSIQKYVTVTEDYTAQPGEMVLVDSTLNDVTVYFDARVLNVGDTVGVTVVVDSINNVLVQFLDESGNSWGLADYSSYNLSYTNDRPYQVVYSATNKFSVAGSSINLVNIGDFGIGGIAPQFITDFEDFRTVPAGFYSIYSSAINLPAGIPTGFYSVTVSRYDVNTPTLMLTEAITGIDSYTVTALSGGWSVAKITKSTTFSAPVSVSAFEKQWSNDRIAEARTEITKHLNGESDAINSPADYMSWIQALIAYRDGQSATDDDPATGTRPTLTTTQKTFTISAAGNADVLTVPAGIKSLDIDLVLTSGIKHRRHNVTVLEKESGVWVWATTLLLGDAVSISISINASGVINITNNEATSLDLTIRKIG